MWKLNVICTILTINTAGCTSRSIISLHLVGRQVFFYWNTLPFSNAFSWQSYDLPLDRIYLPFLLMAKILSDEEEEYHGANNHWQDDWWKHKNVKKICIFENEYSVMWEVDGWGHCWWRGCWSGWWVRVQCHDVALCKMWQYLKELLLGFSCTPSGIRSFEEKLDLF